MHCAEIEMLLYSSTLNDATDMEQFQLKAHLADCESCSKKYSEVRDLVGRLKKEVPLSNSRPKAVRGCKQRLPERSPSATAGIRCYELGA